MKKKKKTKKKKKKKRKAKINILPTSSMTMPTDIPLLCHTVATVYSSDISKQMWYIHDYIT